MGLVLGTAFKDITNSLVKDIITPVIGALTGGVNFDHLFLSLSITQYATLEQAQEARRGRRLATASSSRRCLSS